VYRYFADTEHGEKSLDSINKIHVLIMEGIDEWWRNGYNITTKDFCFIIIAKIQTIFAIFLN